MLVAGGIGIPCTVPMTRGSLSNLLAGNFVSRARLCGDGRGPVGVRGCPHGSGQSHGSEDAGRDVEQTLNVEDWHDADRVAQDTAGDHADRLPETGRDTEE